MEGMTEKQGRLVERLTTGLQTIHGLRAIALGGSFARQRARPDSDLDLGLYYRESDPFPLEAIRRLANEVNDAKDPVVSSCYEWGEWVNGGAWLTIEGQRVDLIYRSLDHLERVIADGEEGRHQLDYGQQPPFGFFSATYPGEVAICRPLFDPQGDLAILKRRVAVYPEQLRQSIVRDYLWAAQFGLTAFAPKFASRGDSWGTISCLTRAIHQLVLVLFAINRHYPLNDKTVLEEIDQFERAPVDFRARVEGILTRPDPGVSTPPATSLVKSIDEAIRLFDEVVGLSAGLYQPRYLFPVGEQSTEDRSPG